LTITAKKEIQVGKRERTAQILLVIHDFGGEAEVEGIASRLEDDQPDLELFLQELEDENLVERVRTPGAMESFSITRQGRHRLQGRPMGVKCAPSRWINPKTGRPRLDWDKD
jgi:DNA-binding MarR family transcriptional regulator